MKLVLLFLTIFLSASAQNAITQPDHVWQGSGKRPVDPVTIQRIPEHMDEVLKELDLAPTSAENKVVLAKTKEDFQTFRDRLPGTLNRISRMLNQGSKVPIYIITDIPDGFGTDEHQKTLARISQDKVFSTLSTIKPRYVGIVGQYDDSATQTTRIKTDGVLRYHVHASGIEVFGLDEDPSLTRIFDTVSTMANSGNVMAKVLATDLVDLRAYLAIAKAIEKTADSPANKTAIVMASGYDSVTSFACLQAKMTCLEFQAIPSNAEYMKAVRFNQHR